MSTIITKRQFPNYRKYEMELAGRPLTLEVGKLSVGTSFRKGTMPCPTSPV